MSCDSFSALMKAVTGNRFLGFLSIIRPMPMPQFRVAAAGELAPVAIRPWTRSAQSEKVDMNEIGNQSRVGSP